MFRVQGSGPEALRVCWGLLEEGPGKSVRMFMSESLFIRSVCARCPSPLLYFPLHTERV